MNALPIVHREMRVVSRARWNYWTRPAFALTGIIAALLMFYEAGPGRFGVGAPMLWMLSVVTLGLVLFYGCLLTADCISSEKREDTLGFLFLTNLKGYDVVAGKISINAITSACGLLAVVPVFFLPLLAGGVTWGETLRVLLGISVSFLLALTLGVWVSTRAKDARNAMMTALIILGSIVAVPLLYLFITAEILRIKSSLAGIPQLSPAMLLFYAREAWYVSPSGRLVYWISITIFLAASATFATLASRSLPKLWRLDGPLAPAPAPAEKKFRLTFPGRPAAARARFRFIGRNPFTDFFLIRFTRFPKGQALLALLSTVFVLLLLGSFGRANDEAFVFAVMILFLMHGMAKFAFIFDATRALNEDRRTSALELLSTTALGPGPVAQGQADAFHIRFQPTMRRVLLLTLLTTFVAFINPELRVRGEDLFLLGSFLWGAVLWTWSDYRTVPWLGMPHSLRQPTHLRAMLRTALSSQLVPWAPYFLVLFMMAESRADEEAAAFLTWLWAIGAAIFQARRAERARRATVRDFMKLAAR